MQAIDGQTVGTVVHPRRERLSSRKLWIAFALGASGRVVVDKGARQALRDDFRSLLPAGVEGVEGTFDADGAVEIVTDNGKPFAKGIVRYSSHMLEAVAGLKTKELPDGDAPRGHPPRRPRRPALTCLGERRGSLAALASAPG